ISLSPESSSETFLLSDVLLSASAVSVDFCTGNDVPTGFNSSPLYTWYSPQISSSVSSVDITSFCFVIHSATIRELIPLSGATRESTIDAISLRAIRLQEEYRFIGEWTLSVSVITFAFLLLANSKAFNV